MLKWFQVGLGLIAALTSGFILFQTVNSFNQLSEHAELHDHSLGGASVEEKSKLDPAKQGHGEKHEEGADRATAALLETKASIPFVSLDEVFANVNEDKSSHTLAIKVDIEFFNVHAKETFKSHQPAVKHLIIQTSREQEYERLATLSGKLYFKELLIRKINDHFQKAIVRDVHFASFFLQ